MPATLSKDEAASREKKATAIVTHLFMQVAVICGAGTGDTEIFRFLTNNNPAETVALMTAAMSTGGLVELLITQIVGRMTDKTGRLPWMYVFNRCVRLAASLIGGGASCCDLFMFCVCSCMVVMSTLTFLNPKSRNIVFLNRMLVWSFG